MKFPARSLVLSIGSTPALVGQVTAIGNAGSSRNLIDASAYGDDWMDYVVGQQDGSAVSVSIAYDPADAGHEAVIDAYELGVAEDFEMELAAAAFHVGFPALLTKCERGGARDGLLVLEIDLKILNPGVADLTS